MKAAIFFADGFEECEGLIVVDMFRRASVSIDTISMNDSLAITTSHQVKIQGDKLFKDIDIDDYDLIILPGGVLGTKNLESCESLKEAILKHYEQGKLTCAICAAPSIFGHLGMLEGKKYTCFPTFDGSYGGMYQQELAVSDGNLITGRGMGATIAFAHLILERIVDQKTLEKLEFGMQYEKTFRELKKPE